jgi:hypothetical protein
MYLHSELFEHPPYSPYLAPSDFYLFPKLKLFHAGQRFSSNQEAIAALEGYFADLMSDEGPKIFAVESWLYELGFGIEVRFQNQYGNCVWGVEGGYKAELDVMKT